MSIKNALWIAKYAPTTIEDSVLSDGIKTKFREIVAKKDLPNLGLFGPAGTGKTSSALAMLKDLGVDREDILFLNASNTNSIDAIRNIIEPFVMSYSSNEELPIRVVILDEADYLTPNAQAALRSLMEHSYSTARFILTANFPSKIIKPLHSRLQSFTIEKPDFENLLGRMVQLLDAEDVSIEDEELFVELVSKNSGDIRKLINVLQQSTVEKDGDKILVIESTDEINELFDGFIVKFLKKDVGATVSYIKTNFSENDCEEFYTFMFDYITENYKKIPNVETIVIQLAQYQYNHAFVANKILNLSAFAVEATIAYIQ